MISLSLRRSLFLIFVLALVPGFTQGQPYPLTEVRAWLYDTQNTRSRSDDVVVDPYGSVLDYYAQAGLNATNGFGNPAVLNFGNKIWNVNSDGSTVYRLVFQLQCDNMNLVYDCDSGGDAFWALRRADCYWSHTDVPGRRDLILQYTYNDDDLHGDLITDYESGWWMNPTNIGGANAPDTLNDITQIGSYSTWSMLDCVDPPGPGRRNWEQHAYQYRDTLYANTDSTLIWEVHFLVDSDWTDNESVDLQFHMNYGKDGHSTDIWFKVQTRNRVVKWIYPENASISGIASSPIIRDGRVYVGCDDAYLYCLDVSDGSLIWAYGSGDRIRSSPAAAYDSDASRWVIHFGCDDGKVYSVTDMGSFPQLKWSTQLQSAITSSPALWGTLLFIGSGDSLHCLFTDDGSRSWAQYLGGQVSSSPAVYWDHVWVGSNSDYLYKITIDGTVLGTYQICGDIVVPVWMAYWDGRVAVGSYMSAAPGSDTMYVIDNLMTSSSKFADGGALARTYTSAFSPDDATLYFGNDNDHLYSIDLSSDPPSLRYKYDTGGDVRSSPLFWNGVVYFGSNSDRFYALDDQTEQPRTNWPFVANGDIQSSPAISVSDSVVVVGSSDGHVYGFYME